MHIPKKLYHLYMNMKISNKLLFGYIVILMVPTICLETIFYQANYNSVLDEYILNEQHSFHSAVQNFSVTLEQISAITLPFESNIILKNYLNGHYTTVSDAMYNYFNYIDALYSPASSSHNVKKVVIYGFRDYPLDLANRLTSIKNFEENEVLIEKIKENYNGFWSLSEDGSIYYYRVLNSNTYPFQFGIIKIETKTPQILECFYSLSKNQLYLYDEQENMLYTYFDNTLEVSAENLDSLREKNKYLFTESLDNFPFVFITAVHTESVINNKSIFLLFSLIVLFIALSFLYYFIARSISHRLSAFNQYIQNTDANTLFAFNVSSYNDEIGHLIDSYNTLILRIEYINNEHFKTQLQKKESEYYALQAQIQPHFLYNTLENIRMNAESHHDTETSEMLLILGKHMRYNLNMSSKPISLEEELHFAKNYLLIHKIRMKEKISIEISVSTELDDIYCPRFLMQPLLENSLLHGYQIGKPLSVQILVTDGQESGHPGNVLIQIVDNGNGIHKDKLTQLLHAINTRQSEANQHVGLLNVNSRLISFYGSDEGILHIKSEPDKKTVVSFFLKKGRESI